MKTKHLNWSSHYLSNHVQIIIQYKVSSNFFLKFKMYVFLSLIDTSYNMA